MLLASALVGRWYGVANSDLPDRATTARFFHKLWFQLTRMAIVMMAILVPAWILIPDNSKFWVTLQLVIPCLGPAVLAISGAYYLSRRLKKGVDS
jgi:cytosine/uracil/thiamine/allantoin permease